MKRLLALATVLATPWFGATSCASTSGVEELVVDSVSVNPNSASIVQGDTVRLVGTALDRNGVAFLGPRVTWISDNPNIALVDPEGLVTGGLPGVAVVTASIGSFSNGAQITVSAAPFAVLSPMTLTFNATVGGADPPEQTVTVANAAGGTLTDVTVGAVTYGAGQATGWLTAAVSADFTTLTIRAAIVGLAAGTYDATVPVGLAGSTAAGSTLTVTLVVS